MAEPGMITRKRNKGIAAWKTVLLFLFLCYYETAALGYVSRRAQTSSYLSNGLVQTKLGAAPLDSTILSDMQSSGNLFRIAAVGGLAVPWAFFFIGREERQNKIAWREYNEKVAEAAAERARLAFIEPKDEWTKEELAAYDGSQSMTGPILIAVDGFVFNCYKGRQFYGAGCEYAIFAGKDATRLLAKGILQEETPKEAAQPLTIAQRAVLAGWFFTFKSKYEIVGRLQGSSGSLTDGVEPRRPDVLL